ncbi:Protein kinase domain-containing protein ppk32 [Psilocybe cubensis]|uniref:Protein kinase domain-containing protein ppk32 n=2 Tax=Psilocybe cubensis TaxID=181762 RepID=A0ACB8H788_PSICU|nr:Protein kinase domain-containing protein ppk32 [Psilocybe cubensis]KAH9483858.1 Protein kinase domain-containing protein ppk32 [Psilocybe cubensis]
MFAAATSFFARTNISQSYSIGSPSQGLGLGTSRPSTPGGTSTGTSLSAPPAATPTFYIGLWKVQSAWHKVTNKRVSVWTFDKRGQDMERLGPQSKERVVEVMKSEASALGRLRHPSILGDLFDNVQKHIRKLTRFVEEMVEPLEETRNELVFATEPVLASLQLAIPDSGRQTSLVELDEIEIQKGVLQMCKGLSFLHTSAKLIHSHLSPETVVINGAGDWKISGLGLTIPLYAPGGGATRWEFPTFDGRVPPYIQRSFDYMAPEYALDEQLVTASDMYSLGCILYAVHCKGIPPFRNHGSLGGLRENASKPVPGIDRLDGDLQVLLRSLITRHYGSRPTPESLPSHAFFSSLPISTLNFLDRSNFTAKTREEKISFMKGLTTVLDRFSEGLRTRKILPSLLEEMKDTQLLPYILPNVFVISQNLSASQFASIVLPSLKPLFAIREPPQNMLTLLDNLTMLQDKTDKNVFREHVLPLVYNALESEHAVVQERALKVVPGLCDTIDYAEVQEVLFPRVAFVFTKTRILTVKVATLVTLLAMVKTLDQTTLTQKLVPLLSKIRTKEPAVMMATLSVQEAMGLKVDREAVATLVLPQLWAMSIGPLLSVGQFQRFMQVIKKLAERVEKEHDQFLRDSQRLEDRSGIATDGNQVANGITQNVDFESLVGGKANGQTIKADTAVDNNASWDDDVWGSIFNNNLSATSSTTTSPSPPHQSSSFASPASSSLVATLPSRNTSYQSRPSNLNPIPLSSTSTASPLSRRQERMAPDVQKSVNTGSQARMSYSQNLLPTPPRVTPQALSQPLQPTYSAPNYNIYASPAGTATSGSAFAPTINASLPLMPQQSSMASLTQPIQPQMGGLLTPSRPVQSSTGTSNVLSKDDWGDFDPLS